MISLLYDVYAALALTLQKSRSRLIRAWVYVPIGSLLVLLVCWGIDELIKLTGVSFPASVAAMILMFLGLVCLSPLIGSRRTKAIVEVLDIPMGFALRYINIFFTPSFVLLPLSARMGGVEAGKIVAVFFLGWVAVFSITINFVRGLQLALGTSKRQHEDAPRVPESIPLTETPGPSESASSTAPLLAPVPAAEAPRVRGSGPECTRLSNVAVVPQVIHQHPSTLPTRAQTFATILTRNLDTATYALLLLASFPILCETHFTLPVHAALTILAYSAALFLPPHYQSILHPVLVCSTLTLLSIYLLSLALGTTLTAALQSYKTSTTYPNLFRGRTHLAPGAGDLFASLLDVSIVSLSLPMYRHRASLRRHLPSILLPSVFLALGSLTLYPLLCSALSISPPRSLAFTSRSLTLALATPAVTNLGGDLNLTAVICIMSGITGVLLGPLILRFWRVPEEDFVTRGVALGANSAAITTAWLLRRDPRAAAMSSLAMVVFGTLVVAATAVPSLVEGVRALAGVQ